MPTSSTRVVALAAALVFSLTVSAVAQRGGQRRVNPPNDPAPEPPVVTGKVIAYEPGKTIALETSSRTGVQRFEFKLDKQTRIELPPRIQEISVGQTLSVWVSKEAPDIAAKI